MRRTLGCCLVFFERLFRKKKRDPSTQQTGHQVELKLTWRSIFLDDLFATLWTAQRNWKKVTTFLNLQTLGDEKALFEERAHRTVTV